MTEGYDYGGDWNTIYGADAYDYGALNSGGQGSVYDYAFDTPDYSGYASGWTDPNYSLTGNIWQPAGSSNQTFDDVVYGTWQGTAGSAPENGAWQQNIRYQQTPGTGAIGAPRDTFWSDTTPETQELRDRDMLNPGDVAIYAGAAAADADPAAGLDFLSPLDGAPAIISTDGNWTDPAAPAAAAPALPDVEQPNIVTPPAMVDEFVTSGALTPATTDEQISSLADTMVQRVQDSLSASAAAQAKAKADGAASEVADLTARVDDLNRQYAAAVGRNAPDQEIHDITTEIDRVRGRVSDAERRAGALAAAVPDVSLATEALSGLKPVMAAALVDAREAQARAAAIALGQYVPAAADMAAGADALDSVPASPLKTRDQVFGILAQSDRYSSAASGVADAQAALAAGDEDQFGDRAGALSLAKKDPAFVELNAISAAVAEKAGDHPVLAAQFGLGPSPAAGVEAKPLDFLSAAIGAELDSKYPIDAVQSDQRIIDARADVISTAVAAASGTDAAARLEADRSAARYGAAVYAVELERSLSSIGAGDGRPSGLIGFMSSDNVGLNGLTPAQLRQGAAEALRLKNPQAAARMTNAAARLDDALSVIAVDESGALSLLSSVAPEFDAAERNATHGELSPEVKADRDTVRSSALADLELGYARLKEEYLRTGDLKTYQLGRESLRRNIVSGYRQALANDDSVMSHDGWLWNTYRSGRKERDYQGWAAAGALVLAFLAPVERWYYNEEEQKQKDKEWEREKEWQLQQAEVAHGYRMDEIGAQGAITLGAAEISAGASAAGNARGTPSGVNIASFG